jgi:hypothetical protein
LADNATCELTSCASSSFGERRFRLADIAQHEKATLIYEYDFGDGWEHQVVVEKVLPPDSQKTYARCLDGKNNSPPEDCGGIFGYYELLKAISNPKHPEHQQLLEWLGRPFDPNHFDLQETNAMLRDLKNLANYFPFRSTNVVFCPYGMRIIMESIVFDGEVPDHR